MRTDLKNIDADSRFLQEKLARLQGHRTKIAPRTKKRQKTYQKAQFERKTKQVSNVSHKIDYQPHFDKTKEKDMQLEFRKNQLEMEPCKFKPDLNKKSMTMAVDKDVIHTRQVPERYQRTLLEEKQTLRDQELADEEMQTMRIPEYPDRRPDDNFYQKNFDWKKEAREKALVKRDEYEKATLTAVTGKPQLNEVSLQLARERQKDADFLKRLPEYIDNRNKKIQALDERYNTHSFKPTLHRPERSGKGQ